MTIADGPIEGLELIGYEKLADQGFALPCFGRGRLANSVYVAYTVIPGDPRSKVKGFSDYSSETVEMLPDDVGGRKLRSGDPWLDVFIWEGCLYIGTKPEIWKQTAHVREAIAASAPFSLLNLAEGVPGAKIGVFASAAFQWLQKREGPDAAMEWQVHSYLRDLVIRGIRRRLMSARAENALCRLHDVSLVLDGAKLRVLLPKNLTNTFQVSVTHLHDLYEAASRFGFRTDISRENGLGTDGGKDAKKAGETLLMRLRRGRGGTQTQIPFGVVEAFFGDDLHVRAGREGPVRKMTLSTSGGRRNTMKLQLPEIGAMRDPFARFRRYADGISYEVYDADSSAGRRIKGLLESGMDSGETQQTRGGATLWKVL